MPTSFDDDAIEAWLVSQASCGPALVCSVLLGGMRAHGLQPTHVVQEKGSTRQQDFQLEVDEPAPASTPKVVCMRCHSLTHYGYDPYLSGKASGCHMDCGRV